MNGQATTTGLVNGLNHSAALLPNGNDDYTPANDIDTDQQPELSVEQYDKELPFVYDGQVPLGDLISRVSREIYTELGILAET